MIAAKTPTKNLMAKTVKVDRPYEVWISHNGEWVWLVLKKWQANDTAPYARWFCMVHTPMVPEGEMGDVYVSEIKANAVKVDPTFTLSLIDYSKGRVIKLWDLAQEVVGHELTLTEVA